MAVMNLTQGLCNSLKARDTRYDVRDSRTTGLFIRIETSGRHTWYMNYRTPWPGQRQRNKKIAPGSVPLVQARRVANVFLTKLYLEKVDPAKYSTYDNKNDITLAELIEKYRPWVLAHLKSGSVTIRTLKLFGEFLKKPVCAFTSEVAEEWQISHNGVLKRATINRRLAALHSLMKWGVTHKYINQIPFKVAKLPQTDSKVIVRYLSAEERSRLLDALKQFKNVPWLEPAVLLSLNTGIRKGTLMHLKWENVNLEQGTLYLPAAIMKGGREAVLPLNKTAINIFTKWMQTAQYNKNSYVFPGDGSQLKDTKYQFQKLMKYAKIENFTWHCLRHDFASQLAMKGVPLQMVQRLMCHASIEMTQRYAHLSPESLSKAVNLIC